MVVEYTHLRYNSNNFFPSSASSTLNFRDKGRTILSLEEQFHPMNENLSTYQPASLTYTAIRYGYLLRSFFAGLLIPFGFAPFHLPGLAILGIALLYAQLKFQTVKQSFLTGFVFGLGFLGFGVSWVYISIHTYGHLNALLSALITLLFVGYLALYPGLVALLYNRLSTKCSLITSCLLFSALWCLGEYFRSTLLSGFPWLLLGLIRRLIIYYLLLASTA